MIARPSSLTLIALLAWLVLPGPPPWGQPEAWFRTGQSATLMTSGVGFDASGGALQLHHPSGLAAHGDRLYVCDRFNNRVLVWDGPPAAWDDPPDFVLGQRTFATNNPGPGRHQMSWPGNVAAGGSCVAVADTENDRILLWSPPPAASAEPADTVLSLAAIPTAPGRPLGWPWGVWTDGTRLAAVATEGAAVLIWNRLPMTDDTPPDLILRNPAFGTPRNITTDGASYFLVSDHNAAGQSAQSGTFFWSAFPAAADTPFAFFRPDWMKGCAGPQGQLIAAGGQTVHVWNTPPRDATVPEDALLVPPNYRNGDGPDAAFAGGRLYLNSYNGNTVLVYDGVPDPGDAPLFALGSPSPSHLTLADIHYVQNPVLASDGVVLYATSDFDRTLSRWSTPPATSGVGPDLRFSLDPWNLQPWDNALDGGRLVLAGKTRVAVWDTAPTDAPTAPARTFAGGIGTASFVELRGAALDPDHLYLADREGWLWVWDGIPAAGTEAPRHTLAYPGSRLNHLHSDGTYLCVAVQEPQSRLDVFRTADFAGSASPTPWKTISQAGGIPLNLTAGGVAFGGSLAIASQNQHAVLLWRDIGEAGAAAPVLLGQPDLTSHEPGIGPNRLFMPASLCAAGGGLWVGEVKFSSRILFFEPLSAPEPAASGWVLR